MTDSVAVTTDVSVASRKTTRRSSRVTGLLAAAVMSALAPMAFGQARPGTPNPRAVGLDALSEETVLNELAGRGLTTLLNRQFAAMGVSDADRQAFAALQAVRELGGPRPFSEPRRIELIEQSVKGLEALLPKLNDPNVLEGYAATLVTKGIEPDVKMLEYFGDSPIIMSRARPASELVIKMLKKVAEDAEKKVGVLANSITNPNDPNINVLEKLEETVNRAKYTQNIITYYEVMGIDLASGAKALTDRKTRADAAIKALRDFDNNESSVAPIVKMQIAKLHLAARDVVNARKEFQLIVDGKIIENKQPVEMKPAPDPSQVNDAKYFLVIADIYDKKPDNALKRMTELETWQKSNITRPEAQQALGVTMGMLRYRVLAAQAELAKAGPARDKLNREADQALEGVANKFPAFRSMIVEQMVSRLPKENPDLAKQSDLVVTTLMMRANVERRKQAPDTPDMAAIELGLKAARELSSDTRTPAPDIRTRDTASLLIPLFLAKQGKELEAAVAYLDYAQKFSSNPEAGRALDQAAASIIKAYAANQSQENRALYKRLLDVMVDKPYNRVDAYYPAADFYRNTNDFEKALKFYTLVPTGDKNEFNARYWSLECVKDLLGKTKDAPRIRQLTAERDKLIGEVRRLGQAVIASNAPDAVKKSARYRLAYLTIETVRQIMSEQQPNTKQVLDLLNGFDQQVEGIEGADALKNRATQYIAEAKLKEGKIDEALAPIKKLMENPDRKISGPAIKLASDADEALQKEFSVADNEFKAAADPQVKAAKKQAMARAAALRTQYLGALVPWLKANMDEGWRKSNMNTWAEREAGLLRSAALLQDDAAKRTELLGQAKAAFAALLTAHKAAPPTPADPKMNPAQAAAAAKEEADKRQALESTLMFRLAQCNFDLGQYKDAAGDFGNLVNENRLGPPVNQVRDLSGALKDVDNPTYWEGFFKRERAVYEWLKTEPQNDVTKRRKELMIQRLKDAYITYGQNIGGEQWKPSLDELRKDIEKTTGQPLVVDAPKPAAPAGGAANPPATAPATAPATQPG